MVTSEATEGATAAMARGQTGRTTTPALRESRQAERIPCEARQYAAFVFAPQADRGARLALSPGQRHRAWAWVGSCLVHGLVLVLALIGLERAVEEPPRPTVRLVFVEPSPPPPAPLGTPAATGTVPTAVQPAVAVEQKRANTLQAAITPKRKEPPPLKAAKPKKAPPPQPLPETEASVPAEPAAGTATATTGQAAPQAGFAAGTVGGIPGGVVGGVEGGVVGGVIGGSGSGPLPVSQVATPPQVLSRVLPEYPRRARRQGIEGLVVLEAILDQYGKIEEEITVLQSVPLLDEAAITALRQWRFTPARDQHGRAVRVILEVPIRFVLN